MNKLITTIAIVALTSVAGIHGAAAMPGGGNPNSKMADQSFGGFQSPQIGGLGGFKLKTGGGDTTSPGDAFYPAGSGNAKRDCLFAGGTPKRVVDGWLCL